MRDVRVLSLLAEQLDIIGWWQLEALGWSPRRIDDTARRRHWQVIDRGVYALQFAPLRREQRWIAATVSTPATLLAGPSAGACWGFRPWGGALRHRGALGQRRATLARRPACLPLCLAG